MKTSTMDAHQLIGSLQVFYSDAKEITRLIDQITRGADSGSFNLAPTTPTFGPRSQHGSFSAATTRSEDLPVEDHIDRLLLRVGSSEGHR